MFVALYIGKTVSCVYLLGPRVPEGLNFKKLLITLLV
jgi:hypothetical protein